MGITELLKAKHDDILRLAESYGAHNIRVFGSVARGESGPQSDVDLLVSMDSGRSLLDLIGFEQDLTEMLGRKVDVVSEGGVSPYLKDRIFAAAVPL